MQFLAVLVANLVDPIIIGVVLLVMFFARKLNLAVRVIAAIVSASGLHMAFLPQSNLPMAAIAGAIWVTVFLLAARVKRGLGA